MSVAINISTDLPPADAALREMELRVSPERFCAEIGPRVTRLVQRNFRAIGPNKKGWPTTEFANRAADATAWGSGSLSLDEAVVIVYTTLLGLRQRLEGGDIKPVNAESLAYPAAPEAYGKTPREFDNLEVGFALDPERGVMRPCLKETRATNIRIGKRKKGGGRTIKAVSETTGIVAIFWLAKGVHQDPDPRWMPTDQQFAEAFDEAFDALLRNKAPANPAP
jgi:hypothetical protein